MATTPNRLQIGTDWAGAIPLINDNFDQSVQNIKDLGANVSTVGTLAVTVASGSLVAATFTLTSQGQSSTSANQVFTQRPVSEVTGITPLLDVFVDTDNNPGFLFPIGAVMSIGQTNAFIGLNVQANSFSNSLGAWTIQLNNRDTVTHTYYIHTSCGYFPTGATGYLR